MVCGEEVVCELAVNESLVVEQLAEVVGEQHGPLLDKGGAVVRLKQLQLLGRQLRQRDCAQAGTQIDMYGVSQTSARPKGKRQRRDIAQV